MSTTGAVRSPLRNARVLWITLIILAVGLRIPLVFGGYGTDNDAWRNIVATERMHAVGHYVPSRAPGFPLFEGLLLLLAPGGWIATNAAAIIAGLIALWIFYLVLKQLQIRERLWTWIALAFGPPLLVGASQTMDYNFGLASSLACYLVLLRRRYALAGVMMAVATGFRPSFVLCNFAVLLFLVARREGWRVFLSYAITYAAAGALIWAPAVLSPELEEPGGKLLKHMGYRDYNLGHVIQVVAVAAKFVFGKIGVIVMAVAVVFMGFSRFRGRTPGGTRVKHRIQDVPREAWLYELGTIATIGGLFALLPGEGIYLLPILPFVLIAMARLLPRALLIAIVIAIVIQPYVSYQVDERKIIAGSYLWEISTRQQDLADAREVLAMVPEEPTVFVVHRFMIFRLIMLGEDMVPTETTWSVRRRAGVALRSGKHDIGYAYRLEPEDRERLRAEGWKIVELRYRRM